MAFQQQPLTATYVLVVTPPLQVKSASTVWHPHPDELLSDPETLPLLPDFDPLLADFDPLEPLEIDATDDDDDVPGCAGTFIVPRLYGIDWTRV